MAYRITHIHLSTSPAKSPIQIKEVKLEGGAIETAAEVAYFIGLGCEYYYVSSKGTLSYVESVHQQIKPPYIRSIHRALGLDELCQLPLF